MSNIGQINRLDDYLFGRYMGEKGDEEQLADFINAVLRKTGKGPVSDLEIVENRMMVADTQEGKSNVLDIRARIAGTRFNVEVQLQNKGNMDKRSFYYGGRELVDSLKKGDKYEDLPNIVTINILDFNYFDGWDNFHSTMHMSEDDHPNFKLDFFEMNFLEVLKLINPDLENPIHQWVMFLKRGTPEEYIKKLMDMNTAIRSAQKRIDFILQDEKSRSLYLLNEKSRMDYNSSISHAERKGEKRGEQRKEKEMILEGLRLGIPLETIAQMAKQPLNYVREIIDEKNKS